MIAWDLLANAVVAGLLLGGFYAAVSLGVSIIFGLLDIANIAQPAFLILGSYAAYVMNSTFGLDPILTGLLFTPVFYLLGAAVYRVYYGSFERRGEESLRGLVFFFGLLFIIEVSLSLKFGVDYRLVQAGYIGKSIQFGGVGIAYRLLVPCLVGLAMTLALHLFLGRTFYGRAIMAVSQDRLALRLDGRQSRPDQDGGLRHRHRGGQPGRRAARSPSPRSSRPAIATTSDGCSPSPCSAAWGASAGRWWPRSSSA